MQTKFIGYDVTIVYDDYERYEAVIEDIDKIDEICQNLENRDDTFEIDYKRKYQLEDDSFVYSDEKHLSIDNPNIPQRELLLRKFADISSIINNSTDARDEDIKECYDILNQLVTSSTSGENKGRVKTHQVVIEVEDSAYEHIIYLFKNLKGVEIIEDTKKKELA